MATSGVNVKMGVSGVAQFKQNMNNAKQAVKTLDSQLALSEKQFKASGDAESYMTEKSELLKAKLEQQKSVLENAEKALKDMADNGVDKSSKAYQDMYRSMLDAKGAILDTESAMNGVSEAGDKASDGVSEMNAQLSRIGDGVNFQNVKDGLSSITDAMGSVIQKAWEVGKAIVKNTLGAGSWADELATTAAQFEIEPEHLYRMRETARLIDTDADTILAAKDKMRKGIESGNKKAMGVLAAFGIEPDQDWDDIFWQAGEAIASLGSEEEKVALSNNLFGKSWRDLMPLFQAGRDAYEDTMGQWSWIGDEAFQNLTKMDDAYQQLESEWDAFQKKFEAAMAPAMTQTMEIITGLLQEFNDYLSSDKGQQMLQALGDAVAGLFSDLSKIDPDAVMNSLKAVFDKIYEGLKWISDNKDGVVKAVEAFIGAWALMKTATGVTTVLELINGLKWLKRNPNIPIPGTDTGTGAGAADTVAKTTGGYVTSITNGLNGILPGIANWLSMNGAPVVDWLTHESPLAGVLTGRESVGDLWQRFIDKFSEESIQEFKDNWDPNNPDANVLAQFFGRRDQNQDAAERLGTANWLPSYMGGTIGNGSANTQQALDKMNQAAEETISGSDTQKKASKEMTEAADQIKTIPGVVGQAVADALSRIRVEIDGETAGRVISDYVGAGMGGEVMRMVRE